MSNANIAELKVKLTPGERRRLKTKVTGHGTMISAAIAANVSRHTIYNAIAGKNLQVDIANKIRTFLGDKIVQNDTAGII
ncbi:hypothetical protein [Chitinophaga sp. YR573]|uniref:hypothetical protein n=1 Tax=Chitinophaga sp. YR573 TaxID=1881040 RepID=UPI000B7F20EB|nr:hypothetical protein [Chitinophaga sp. YR573]